MQQLTRPEVNNRPNNQTSGAFPIPQQDGKRKARQAVMMWLEDSWILELLAALLSAAALISICGILMHFDDQPQPIWPYMSLNTVVSWLGTVARGCITLLLSRSIGQLKWIWMLQGPKRALSDVQTFDAASRGALGSVELMVMQRGVHLAVFACVAVVLSFAFDPFLQNLVHTSLRSVPDSLQAAYLANGSRYETAGPRLGAADYIVDPVMKSNVYSSLFNNDVLQPWAIPQYQCSTGNCTWNPTTTLAVSYACTDTTSLLYTVCEELADGEYAPGQQCARNSNPDLDICGEVCYVSLPDRSASRPQLFATYNPKAAWFGQGTVLGTDLNISHWNELGSTHSLATISMIRASTSSATGGADVKLNDTLWTGTECTLYPCVQRISSSIRGALYTESFAPYKDPSTGKSAYSWCETEETSGPVSIRPPWLESSNSSELEFGFETRFRDSIEYFLAGAFVGNVSLSAIRMDWNVPNPRRIHPIAYANADILQAIYYGNMSGCEPSKNYLECAMNNTARAMTKTFRDSAYMEHGLDGANMTIGQTFVSRTYVSISWYWFSVPILIWLPAIVSWLAALLKTRKLGAPIWRNNPLPHFFLRQSYEMDSDQPHDISSRGYTDRSRSILTKLHVGENHAHMD